MKSMVIPSQVKNVVTQIVNSGNSVGSGSIHGYFENLITGINGCWKSNRAVRVLTGIQASINELKNDIKTTLDKDNMAIIDAANSALTAEEQNTMEYPEPINNVDLDVSIENAPAEDADGIQLSPDTISSKLSYLGTVKAFINSIVIENIRTAASNNPLAFAEMGQSELSASLSTLSTKIDEAFSKMQTDLEEVGEDLAAQQKATVETVKSGLQTK